MDFKKDDIILAKPGSHPELSGYYTILEIQDDDVMVYQHPNIYWRFKNYFYSKTEMLKIERKAKLKCLKNTIL